MRSINGFERGLPGAQQNAFSENPFSQAREQARLRFTAVGREQTSEVEEMIDAGTTQWVEAWSLPWVC
ncbi:MAG: hypothetical protein ACYDB1_08940 [Acidiferrobacteraceae bacterium]